MKKKTTTHKTVRCHDCAGHGLAGDYSGGDFNGPAECRTCNGTGELTQYANGGLAKYPGGPFVGC